MSELWSQFHFLRPVWLLAVIPAALAWWRLFRVGDPRLGLSDDIAPHLLEQMVTRPADRPRFRPATVILPLLLVAVLALAGPSFRRQPSPFAEDKSQLILVMKMSPSILTEDVQPSRLERVRTKIHDLLELRKGAGAGLIVYSGSAHLVMPVTSDGDVINHMLEALDPEIMPVEGDDLASALDIAADQLRDQPTPGSILIVADSVQPNELPAIGQWKENNRYTVQLFVPLPNQAAVTASGTVDAADALGAKMQQMTADDQDIRTVASRADRAIAATSGDGSMQWRDDGYVLVPIVMIGLLLWCRRGWSVET